jgi:hypothetical protein
MSIANSIEALGAIELEEPDEDGPHIDPAATPELRAWIAQRIGAAIPSELAELLGTTSRVFVAGAKLELDDFQDEHALGLGELLRVHDYGNGDGLMLELGEPTCRPRLVAVHAGRALARRISRAVRRVRARGGGVSTRTIRAGRATPALRADHSSRAERRRRRLSRHRDAGRRRRRGERVTLRRR